MRVLTLLSFGRGRAAGCAAAFALLTPGCNSGNVEPTVPSVPVNVQLVLTDQQNRNLRFDNGVVAVAGGLRGILVVRESAGLYRAFERNCPYQPDNACARVGFDASPAVLLRDSCCGSQFNLQGQPTGGPAARPLRQYATALSGNILNITN